MEILTEQQHKQKVKPIKLIVWDMDNTLWDGILAENPNVTLKAGIIDVIKTLDNRGILQSIASKNNSEMAINKLKEFNLLEYFLNPQIHWGPKSQSIEQLAKITNINVNAIAFVDDEPYELGEVKYNHPSVLCFSDHEIHKILGHPRIKTQFVTDDAKNRRCRYIEEMQRAEAENKSDLPKTTFLTTLNMEMTIAKATEADLLRAEELTVRTHQLNTTGYSYSHEELQALLKDPRYKILTTSLNDKFGSYGIIGLSLIECTDNSWAIKLFILSCRVMSRGVGNAFLTYILESAKSSNVKLYAEFIHTDANKPMYVTYKFHGFHECRHKNDLYILEHKLINIPKNPAYINIIDKT